MLTIRSVLSAMIGHLAAAFEMSVRSWHTGPKTPRQLQLYDNGDCCASSRSASVQRARAGGLRSSELTDTTITLSSLGDNGVETLYPIISPPQVAVAGAGSVVRRPWVVGEGLAVRRVITATLAGDHRVSDGHRGALFPVALDRLLQKPEEL